MNREESPAPLDSPAHARSSAAAPPKRGVPIRSPSDHARTRSRAARYGTPCAERPGSPRSPRAAGSVARGVPARSTRAGRRHAARSIDDPGRPAPGGSARPVRDSAAAAGAAALRRPGRTPRPTGVPGRRTVTIRGRGTERNLAGYSSRSPAASVGAPIERAGFRPDRVAMWAVLLGSCWSWSPRPARTRRRRTRVARAQLGAARRRRILAPDARRRRATHRRARGPRAGLGAWPAVPGAALAVAPSRRSSNAAPGRPTAAYRCAYGPNRPADRVFIRTRIRT